MCDVHLVPEVSEDRLAVTEIECGECRKPIAPGQMYRHIEGTLDDGSGDRYLYVAHCYCFEMAELDSNDDGCFTYGGVRRIG